MRYGSTENSKKRKENITLTDKFVLNWGIHRGTLTSRDIGEPKYFDSEGEAQDELRAMNADFAKIGYQIWFARLTTPDGTEKRLMDNPY